MQKARKKYKTPSSSRELNGVQYESLFPDGKLSSYLADIDSQAEEMFSRIVKQMAEKNDITESLKSSDQMEWVRGMCSVQNAAAEIVNNNLGLDFVIANDIRGVEPEVRYIP